jgi:dTDP-4-dehydrorhamnose reductase
LIFISTDFVFDGVDGPYKEDDIAGGDFSKISWYGITKFEAEKIITSASSDFVILRIAYPYGAHLSKKDDIARRILKLYESGNLYGMFFDQIITPTFIDDLTQSVSLIVNQNQNGTFHIASPKLTNQWDFAKYLIGKFGGDLQKVKRASIGEFLANKNNTPRPINGGLLVGKIANLGFMPTDWDRGIDTIFTQSGGKLI